MNDILYPVQRARLLRKHADALEEICVRLARDPASLESLPEPRATVGHFLNVLLAGAVQADRHRSGAELALIAEYFRDGWELRDNDEWASDAGRLQHQVVVFRAYVDAAKRLDARNGGQLVSSIDLIIGEMAALIVTSDGHAAAGEGRFIAELRRDLGFTE